MNLNQAAGFQVINTYLIHTHLAAYQVCLFVISYRTLLPNIPTLHISTLDSVFSSLLFLIRTSYQSSRACTYISPKQEWRDSETLSDACRRWRPAPLAEIWDVHWTRQLALELSLASYHIGLRISFDVARYHIIRRCIYALNVAFVRYLYCLFSACSFWGYAYIVVAQLAAWLSIKAVAKESGQSTVGDTRVIALSTLRNTPILRQEWLANRGMRLYRPGLS